MSSGHNYDWAGELQAGCAIAVVPEGDAALLVGLNFHRRWGLNAQGDVIDVRSPALPFCARGEVGDELIEGRSVLRSELLGQTRCILKAFKPQASLPSSRERACGE